MHIGIIGGLDRGEQRFMSLAAACGHSLQHHTGDMSGRGSDSLHALVARSHLVIVITDVNSHAAVLAARRLGRTLNTPCRLVRRFGLSRFRALLDELAAEPTSLAG